MQFFTPSRIASLFRTVSLAVFISLLCATGIHAYVYAAYGEGTYGGGVYNRGSSSASSGSSSNSTSPSSESSPPGCSERSPDSVPDLFQINPHKDSMTVFFAPIASNRDRYYMSYGTKAGEYQHGFEFLNSKNGVIAVEVKDLHPTTTYYFKVRAGNGCQPGEWSNQLSAKTGQRLPTYRWSSLPKIVATGVQRLINPSAITTFEMLGSSSAPTQQRPTSTPPATTDDMGTSPVQKSPVTTSPSPPPATEAPAKQNSSFWQWLFGLFRGF